MKRTLLFAVLLTGTVTHCSSACDVGLVELSDDEVLVYPNPTNDLVTIEFTNEVVGQLYFELYNLAGELLLRDVFSQAVNLVDLNTLRSGI